MLSHEQWGRRPGDWAELAEPSNEPLFERVLDELGIVAGTRLLDLACGSGYAARMASRRGAEVTGLDITPELIEIAAERVPRGRFVRGGMDALPFDDACFDAVTAFSALQFALDPAQAVAEAFRVLRPGGVVGVAGFAEADRNESTALHLALEPLRNAGPHRHLPYALAAPGGFEALLLDAGFVDARSGEVEVVWAHPDVDRAVRAVLASGGGAMAIEGGGEAAARAALETAVAPFTHDDGSVAMRNVMRYALARRPE
jgi:SAM-dependent methyltransferase